ncbi:MAG: helix-turn-helix domain-containing protein [Candidatus Dojkabacteria bacterium]
MYLVSKNYYLARTSFKEGYKLVNDPTKLTQIQSGSVVLFDLDSFSLNTIPQGIFDRYTAVLFAKKLSISQKLDGFESGAAQVLERVPKNEFTARLRATLRRINLGGDGKQIDVLANQSIIRLKGRQAQLFCILAKRPGAVYSKHELIEQIKPTMTNNSLNVQIYKIREKFKKVGISGIIQNKRNHGIYLETDQTKVLRIL